MGKKEGQKANYGNKTYPNNNMRQPYITYEAGNKVPRRTNFAGYVANKFSKEVAKKLAPSIGEDVASMIREKIKNNPQKQKLVNMANTEKIVVQVVVKGEKQLVGLSKNTEKATKKTGKLQKELTKMATKALAVATAFATINRVIGSAIKSFRDFEFQMAKVKAVTGASEKDFKKLSNTAKELGRTTFFTAQQVAELQTNYGKLGFSTREILDAQEATLQLATATDVDLGRAAIVAGASIRGFGLDASEAGRVVDVMAKAFTSSALDIEKFQTSMTKVAPIASAAGISIEATTAVMGTLTDAGIEASIAGTSLRNIFLKMQDSSSDLSKFLGYTVNSSDDLERALNDLNTAGLSNEEIMGLVDLRQVAAFNTMITGSILKNKRD